MTVNSLEFICFDCGKKHCKGIPDGHIATTHIGRCDICGEEKPVTQPRDFGGFKPFLFFETGAYKQNESI